jgi:hypothetical protein
MTPVTVDFAAPADDAAIRELFRRQPMPGRVTITYEREPDFSLGCAVTGEDCRILVARAGAGEIAGVACRSTRRVFLNGSEHRLGYLSQLRVDERFRGQWLVSRGFAFLRQLHDSDPVPAYLTAIVDGNPEAEGVLVRRRRRRFPDFHPVAGYCTLAIEVRGFRPPLACDVHIAPANPSDLAELVQFLRLHGARRQFFPAWSEVELRRLAGFGLGIEDLVIARHRGKITGVAGLWDQSAYKQAIVCGYSGWLRATAPLYNFGAPLLRRRTLPPPGAKLRNVYAALICVANDEVTVFASLLRELYNLAGRRSFAYLLVGLDARDPLLPAARAYKHVLYSSRLYLAAWSDDGGQLHEQLDQRPAYVDIAAL